MYKILICDDEKDIVSALEIFLQKEGYETVHAYNGKEAIEKVQNEKIDLAILDIMMPEVDGLSALDEIRKNSNIPVLLLTAKSEESDMISGLNAGADDYITKPFLPAEVNARVRSHLRRYMILGSNSEPQKGKLEIGSVALDDTEKTVSVDGSPISLTPTEFEILKLFMQHPGTLFSPKEIYKRIWKDEPFGAEGTVAVHIRHLREKIEIDPANPRYLKAIWGKGYKIEKQPKIGE